MKHVLFCDFADSSFESSSLVMFNWVASMCNE